MARSGRCFTGSQQIEYGSWEDAAEVLKKKLDDGVVVKYAIAMHDDAAENKPHFHFWIQFKSPSNCDVVSNLLSVPVNQIEVVRSKVGSLVYLTHGNSPEKVQYSTDAIVASSFDISQEIDGERAKMVDTDPRRAEILEKIVSGEYPAYRLQDFVSVHEYSKYKIAISNAKEYHMMVCGGVNKDMEVVFITGPSGAGKTSLAKMLCEERRLDYFVSSGGKNPIDDYAGQPAIILDDLRGNTLKVADLLKMLDNNTSSNVGARFYNKNISACKFMVITSIYSLERFFDCVEDSKNEDLLQLKRRCGTLIEITAERMDMYMYDKLFRDYRPALRGIPNPVHEKFKPEALTREAAIEMARGLLGSLVDGFENMIQIDDHNRFQELRSDGDNPFDDYEQLPL